MHAAVTAANTFGAFCHHSSHFWMSCHLPLLYRALTGTFDYFLFVAFIRWAAMGGNAALYTQVESDAVHESAMVSIA
jgi:hypothetical protein